MYVFGSNEMQIEMLLDYLSGKEIKGPKKPKGPWQEMSLKQQEIYFVYLRIALDYCANESLISEEATTILYTEYLELFKHLATKESRLKKALRYNTHRFLGGESTENKKFYQDLVGDID